MPIILLLVSMLLDVVALIALIRGKAWFMRSKKQAAGWLLIAVVMLVVSVVTMPQEDAARQTTTAPTEPQTTAASAPVVPSKPSLEVIESSSVTEDYGRYIVGTVKNNSSKTYSYAQVEINLYDKDNNQIGSTLANVNNLEPGGTWKFKAPILEDSAVGFKIKDVRGF